MRKFRANAAKTLLSGLLLLGAPAMLAQPRHEQQKADKHAPSDPAHYDQWLINEVRHNLVLLPFYSVFDNLQYKVDGDKVTLLGHVARPSLKDDAESAVKKIEGVEQVDNQIEILPLSPNDNRIRRAEYRHIYSSSVLDRYAIQAVPPIHIIVKNGHVTLEGTVATEMDKNVAGIRAKEVAGVFSVANNLQVENEKK